MLFKKKAENQNILFPAALREKKKEKLNQVSQLGTLYKSLANLDPQGLAPWAEPVSFQCQSQKNLEEVAESQL